MNLSNRCTCHAVQRVDRSGFILIICCILGGCVTIPPPTHRIDEPVRYASAAAVGDSSSTPSIEAQIRREAGVWWGTPHRLGGTDTTGIDCSAFVQRIYSQTFDLLVPRTTRLQSKTGFRVARDAMQPGDLVFFRPTRTTRHVGIYLSDGNFVHASKRFGVAISNMSEPYWRNRYWMTRRLLDSVETGEQASAAVDSTTGAPAQPLRNTGW